MIHDPLAGSLIALPVALAAGIVVGLVYFRLLDKSIALYGRQGRWFGPVALTLGRLLGVGLLLALAAHFGALPLLAAFAGFLLARAIALRAARRA
jgi:N-ATPase, AtpR subunit